MTVYVVATTARPTVVCPSWCESTEEEHVDELTAWGGYAVHQWHVGLGGDTPSALDKFDLSAGVGWCADGTPMPDDPFNALSITIEGREYTPDQALEIARAIQVLVHDVSPAGGSLDLD